MIITDGNQEREEGFCFKGSKKGLKSSEKKIALDLKQQNKVGR